MKKWISLLLAAALVVAMTSCGNQELPESSSSETSVESSELNSESASDVSDESSESKEEVESAESVSKEESSASTAPESKPESTSKPSTSSKPITSSKPAASSKPAESSKPQEPPIPKPESSASAAESAKPSKPSVGAEAVYDAMDRAVAARHNNVDAAIMNMPMGIDDGVLTDMFGISLSDVASYKGTYAGTMTNCDIMLVVEAKNGKLETVKKALQDKQNAQKKQFEHYSVMGNLERLEASKVVTSGNYAALLMVGVMGDDEEYYDCAGDVSAANSAFSNALK